MQSDKDNYTLHDCNCVFEVVLLSLIGDREEQQDSAGYEIKEDGGIIVVGDGMGGHEGGKIASNLVVDCLLGKYLENYPSDDIPFLLHECVDEIDQKVTRLTKDNGSKMQAGSTLVSIVIREKELFWISVGDSRAYVFRDDEMVQVTRDHNYQLMIEESKRTGTISQVQYDLESIKSETLISFIGIDGVPLIDYNEKPFKLEKNDKILLVTDGLYKLVSNEEIRKIVSNFINIKEAVKVLDTKAQRYSKKNKIERDNMTIALIRIL